MRNGTKRRRWLHKVGGLHLSGNPARERWRYGPRYLGVKLRGRHTSASAISFLSCVRRAMTGQAIGVSYVYANPAPRVPRDPEVASVLREKSRVRQSRSPAELSPITLVSGTNDDFPSRWIVIRGAQRQQVVPPQLDARMYTCKKNKSVNVSNNSTFCPGD